MTLVSSRAIKIHAAGDALVVVPPPQFSPMDLPRFPLSQLHRLHHMAAVCRRQHDRCLVVSLMLGANQELWVRPQLITQRCGRDGANWNHSEMDYLHREKHHLIGGTFQSAAVRSMSEAMAVAPRFDGLHLVAARDRPQDLYVLVHHSERLHALDPDRLFYDDIADELDRYEGQLERI